MSAFSYNITISTHTTPNLTVPFPYISQDHVHVELNGVRVLDNTLSWQSAGVVVLPSIPAAGVSIKVFRETPRDNISSTFSVPSVFDAADLNRAFLQLLYVTQEAFDVGGLARDDLATITDYVNTAMAAAADSATAAAASEAGAAAVVAGIIAQLTVKVTGADTTPSSLSSKVTVSGGLLVQSVTSPGGNEKLNHELAASDIVAAVAALGLVPVRTGTIRFTVQNTADTGWRLFDDGTIGNAGSGATYANVAALPLFTLMFNNFLDANAALLTGAGAGTTRGAQTDAATAWAANCRISLPKTLGRAIAVAGAGSGLTSRALGVKLGEETHLLIEAETPIITRTPTGTAPIQQAGHANGQGANNETIIFPGGTTAITINAITWGGDGAHNNMQPTTFLNAEIKL